MKVSIVIADDESNQLELMAYNLKKADFIIHQVENGEEALEKVEEINPDLVGAWTTTFSDGNSTAIQVLTLNSDGTGSVSNEWDHGETFFSELIWTCDVTTIYVTTLINNENDSGDYELSNNNDTLVINTNGMVLVYVRI